MRNKTIFQKLDWITILLYFFLVLAGWVNIYAAVYDPAHHSIMDLSQNYGKQLLWILTSVVLISIIMLIDGKFWSTFSFLIYGLMIVLLVGVLLGGREIAGSKSWFQIGSFSLQPAEFAKFATALALAKYLSGIQADLSKFKTRIRSLIIIFLPAGLILLQNDTGSALVYVAFILVLYREGMSGFYLLAGLAIAVLFILTLLINKFILVGGIVLLTAGIYYFVRKVRGALLILSVGLILSTAFVFSVDYAFENFLESHQKKRINVLIGKEADLHGAGYNVNQSKIAIGSGGLTGKGFLKGTQTKFNFVPEQSTDFIFCTVGEEWGFLGGLVVITAFVLLLMRIISLAERQRSAFSRIYGYGVASVLFFHFVINIGMTIGLVPVIGIPLPFFSYGGSSLWGFTILLFIFVKLDAQRLEIL